MINIRHILDNSADILTDKAQLKWFKVRIAGKAQGELCGGYGEDFQRRSGNFRLKVGSHE